jgi:hypothetical protein
MASKPDIGPPHHLSRLMTPDLDPTTGAKREPLRRLWPAAIAGTIVLGIFNAQGLEKWAEHLPDSPVASYIIDGALDWKAWMDKLGPADVFEAVRRAFQAFRGGDQ